MSFYRWRVRDFMEVQANELEEGDEIAYGNSSGLKYGAIPIENVTVVQGVGIWLQYTLPVGADAQSSEVNDISIYWNGNKPRIEINQQVGFYDSILIRRQ